jgi:hypothetical protein
MQSLRLCITSVRFGSGYPLFPIAFQSSPHRKLFSLLSFLLLIHRVHGRVCLSTTA